MKDIEALIDATPRGGEANLARLKAFAEVLGEDVEAVVVASDGRILARSDKARKAASKVDLPAPDAPPITTAPAGVAMALACNASCPRWISSAGRQ